MKADEKNTGKDSQKTSKELAKEEALKKKRKQTFFAFLKIAALIILVLTVYILYATKPLDEIQDYQVDVVPQADGTLEITYSYDWKVLDSRREGPLSWVSLGMANYDYDILDYGGAIAGRYYDFSSSSPEKGPYARFSLNALQFKGDRVNFWFKVSQGSMLCENPENPDQPFYDFTPGWFNRIKVRHYRFTWKNPAGPVEHNADYVLGDTLVWEGDLRPGKKRSMKVTYDISAFEDSPQMVVWTPSEGGSSESPVNPATLLSLFLFSGVLGFIFFGPKDNYDGGRGYGGSYYHYHGGYGGGGGGGGCACACAGCACACACAGGGRAGCSQKDFHHSVHLPKNLPETDITV